MDSATTGLSGPGSPASDSTTAESPAPLTQAAGAGSVEPWTRTLTRLVVSASFAVILGAIMWITRQRHLRPPIEVVGYPTFADFDFHPAFLAYRLAVWEVPIVTVLFYLVLGWRGPLAAPRGGRPSHRGQAHGTGAADADLRRAGSPLWLVLPAVVVAVTVSSARGGIGSHLSVFGAVAGLAYVGIVLAVAAGYRVLRADRGVTSLAGWAESVCVVHGPAAALVVTVCLCRFLRGAETVSANGAERQWPWVPVWFCVVLVAVATAWPVVLRWRGRPAATVERWVVQLLGGSTLVTMATSALPGPNGPLSGFDDMMSVTGADLMSRGYFPWRDTTMIHGVFEDGLRSWAGFGLFEHTLWGADAAAYALWAPLAWVALFVFTVWASRGRAGPLLVTTTGLLWFVTLFQPPLRWCVFPVVFVLLAVALRRRRPWWTALLTFSMFAQAVLVPESSFQVIAITLVLVGHDVVERRRGQTWWAAMRLTRHYVGAGLVLTLLWLAFLAYHSSVGAFIDYYRVFGPGHVEAGAVPFGPLVTARFEAVFIVSGALVSLTVLTVGLLVATGRRPTERQWVALACAILAGLYGEKALGRYDPGHLAQSIYVALPLGVLWACGVASVLDRLARRWLAGRRAWPSHFPVVSVALVVALVVLVPSIPRVVWRAPGHNKAHVEATRLPKLGYSAAGTVDTAELRNFGSVIKTLSGPGGGFFDFTNTPGYFYYLLGLDPQTTYFHVSMAEPEFAQEQLVDQLKADPPAVVAFQGPIGLSSWDGLANEVRHFIVSQYLLSNWTPVARTDDVLFLVRNDLLDQHLDRALASDPSVSTADLYAAQAACDWGSVPDFLPSPVTRPVTAGIGPSRAARQVLVTGWAVDAATDLPASQILVGVGHRVIGVARTGAPRPDVAASLGAPAAEESGFVASFLATGTGRVRVYAKTADGQIHPLMPPPGSRADPEVPNSVIMPDGRRVPVDDAGSVTASVDSVTAEQGRLSTVDIPLGTDLSRYGTARFLTGGHASFGAGRYLLTDTPSAPSQHGIAFGTLPVTGGSISVRVGSCLQWHGYAGSTLLVFHQGGRDPRELQLAPPS